jgi:hypothetical protein
LTEFDVRVVPRAKRTALGGLRDGAFLIRLAAPPVDGAANDALISFLSTQFGLPRRAIRIVSGERSRRKRVAVDGLSAEEVQKRLL